MLGKLFKYDMKALSRTLVPLHVAVLVLGLVSCVAGFAGHTVGESGSSPERNVFMAVITLAFLLSMVALFVAVVATFVIVIARFYRNLFTDEGYLTLTLPVTANQIMLSKTLAGSMRIGDDDAIVRALLGTVTGKANFDCHEVGLLFVLALDSMPGRSCGTAKTAIVYNTVKSPGWQASLSHRVMFSPPVPRKNTGAHTRTPARARAKTLTRRSRGVLASRLQTATAKATSSRRRASLATRRSTRRAQAA